MLSEIILRLLLLLLFLITEYWYPRHMDILPGLTAPYRAESNRKNQLIPTHVLFAGILILPVSVFVIANTVKGSPAVKIDEFLALSGTLVLNGVVTNILKLSVGRPRPDFISRCNPVSSTWEAEPICSGVISDFQEGYKSFPSGHTSWSFATLLFLTLYLAGKFKALSQFRVKLPQLCISLAPIVIGCCIGWSRVHDDMHHLGDVVAGAVIGCIISSLCYFHYFHSLFSHNSDRSIHEAQDCEL